MFVKPSPQKSSSEVNNIDIMPLSDLEREIINNGDDFGSSSINQDIINKGYEFVCYLVGDTIENLKSDARSNGADAILEPQEGNWACPNCDGTHPYWTVGYKKL